MSELSVVIIATDSEQRAVLQVLVDGTGVARTVHSCASFPMAGTDPVVRRIHSASPGVALVDIPSDNPTTALHAIEAEDIAVAILEFASGALGVLQATTAAYPGYPRRLEVTGSEGTIVLEHDRIVAADLRNPPANINADTARDQNQSSSSPVVSDVRGHQAVFEDFIHAVQHDSKPACDGHEGRRSLAVIEAIYRAAEKSDGVADV